MSETRKNGERMTEIIYRSDMSVDLVESWGDDEMIARAARVSTNSDLLDQGKIKGLIGYLIRNSHTSPLEHVGATFRLELPLFVRDQIVRHRTFSYNIRSFRFGEASPEFYLPASHRPLYNAGSGAHPKLVSVHPDERPLHDITVEEFRHIAEATWRTYTHLLEYGVAEEVARGVLPTNLYTSMYMTSNLWAWLQFLDKRIESEKNKPQFEIEVVAKAVLEELERLFPVTMGAWKNV